MVVFNISMRHAAILGLTMLGSLVAATPCDAQDRMPPISMDKFSDAQKKAAEAFAQGRGYAVRGPFVPLIRSPEVMLRAKAMGDYLRFQSSLGPRLNEMVILITAREWTQQYEWHAHADIARQSGIARRHRRRDRRRSAPCGHGRRRGHRLRHGH
jgi:4-carboxymuconolactone decarboxylase